MMRHYIMKQIHKNKNKPLKALSILLIFLCSCVLILASIILSQIFFEIFNNYEANKIIFKSSYGIEKEAASFDMYSREYNFYRLMSKYVIEKKEKLYINIKEKLPKNDALLDIFAFRLKYPLLSEKNFNNPIIVQDILLLLDKLKIKKSNILGVEKIYKTEIVSHLLDLIINNDNRNKWTIEHIQKYLDEFLANQINYINDDNSKEHLYLLFLMGEVQLNLYNMQLMKKFPDKNLYRCNKLEYKLLMRHLQALYKIANYCRIDKKTNCLSQYRNARSTPKQWPDLVFSAASTTISNVLKQKEELDNFDKEFCKSK